MSANSTKSNLSKADLQVLVTSNDSSISLVKPVNKRSECWSNFSQVYHINKPQDYIVCLQCKTVLKWTSENGTRVMTHHNCLQKSVSRLPLDNERFHHIVNSRQHQKNVPCSKNVLQKHVLNTVLLIVDHLRVLLVVVL